MRRVATVLAAATTLLPTPAALAGGSWLQTERPFYRPGEVAVARTVFGPGAYEGTVRDGPFEAYIVQQGDWIRPGSIHRRAIDVGRIDIARARGKVCCWVASIAFVVPDVAPGEYWIDYCNVPCRIEGVGDLDGAAVLIGATEREALLGRRLQRAERRTERLRERLARDREATAQEPQPEMHALPPSIEPAAEERIAGLVPLAAGIVAGLLMGMMVRRRPRVVALVPYDPLAPPAPRRSTRRRLR